jgi:phosphate transport system permease protein
VTNPTSPAGGALPPDPSPRAQTVALRVHRLRALGLVFQGGVGAVAVGLFLLIAAFVGLMAYESVPSVHRYGLSFFTNPVFVVEPTVVVGLLVSALALLLAVPVALGVALFAAEIGPRWLRTPLAYLVDLGASIPSVVYGFWALEVLVPWMRTVVQPRLAATTGHAGPFSGPMVGTGDFTASIVLAIMIVPTISALAREALLSVPRSQREAALSLGATRWDAARMAVLGPATPGIFAGVMLGLGRAIGETIAVVLVIGNIPQLPTSLFSAGATIPTVLVTVFPGAIGLQVNELIELGLLLLALSFAVNLGARLLVRRLEQDRSPKRAFVRRRRPVGRPLRPDVGDAADRLGAPSWWPEAVARRGRVLLRRKAVYWVVVALLVGALAAAIVPLGSLVATMVSNGGGAVVTPSFYTSEPPPFCLQVNASTACPLGGIGPLIEGTLILLGLASLVAVPVGILTAIYLSEYGRHRFAQTLGLLVDTMVGVPTILVGVFVFAMFLRYDHLDAQSALAGAAALAIIMIPIVTRATEIALRTVPTSVREAALALGFPRHRVTLRIVLGNSKSAIVTGNLLALGRAGGETAALLLTAGSSTYWFQGLHHPIGALGPQIFLWLTSAVSPNWTEDAWGAALVLLLIMAAVSLAARLSLRTGGGDGSV